MNQFCSKLAQLVHGAMDDKNELMRSTGTLYPLAVTHIIPTSRLHDAEVRFRHLEETTYSTPSVEWVFFAFSCQRPFCMELIQCWAEI